MKVFLSYALPPYDSVLPARLRANALAYNVELLLPNTDERRNLTISTRRKIKQSQAIIAFVANRAPQIEAVNLELQEATQQNKPIIALVESINLVKNISPDRIVVFNRSNPSQHETRLFQVLNLIGAEQRGNELVTALAGIGLIALGLYAFGELTKD
jgi:hypothetical protein